MKAVYKVLLGCIAWATVGVALPACGESIASGQPATGAEPTPSLSGGTILPEKPTAAVLPGAQALGLRDFVRMVRKKNEQIAYQGSEWAISQEAVKGARAIFEPTFINTYQYQNDYRRNTVQELVSQGFAEEYWERSSDYQAAVEGLVQTGARLRLGYTRKDFKNSVEDKYGVLKESQTVFGLSVVQPLMKGAGVKTTMAGIEVAEAEADIAFQNYRGQMMRVLSEAIVSYWDLALAREKYRVRKDSERNAAVILDDNVVRVKTGKMAETEILEAEAGLAMRRSLVSEAMQAIAAARNNMRTYLSVAGGDANGEFDASEPLTAPERREDFSASLSRAFKLRSEYLASQRKMAREDVRLVFAANQAWPQLDLKGSYNMNGLDDSADRSFRDASLRDHETWSLGFELRIPLGGDKKGQSDLEASRQRKRQALLEFKAVEVSLTNAVDTAVKTVQYGREQLDQLSRIVEMNRRLLEAEIAKFKAGKSNSRSLLERDEEVNKALEAKIEAQVKFRKALLQLEFAEGALLTNYGVDVMEAKR